MQCSANKEKLTCQAVVNSLQLKNVPEELDCLNTLEVILITKKLLFEKIVITPKGKTPKLHGSVVNVSVNVNETCNQLATTGREL